MNSFQEKTKINLGYFKLLLVAAVFGLAFFNFSNIARSDDNIDGDCTKYLQDKTVADMNCDQLTGDAKDKCRITNGKINDYCELLDIKNKQQNTLNKQLQLIDLEQKRNQTDLQKTQELAKSLDLQISDLEREINSREDEIKYQKIMLANLMQVYYEYDQNGILGVVLADEDFSTTLKNADYVGQQSMKVSDVLSNIQKARNDLQNDRNILADKKTAAENTKSDLADKKTALLVNENQKQSLLTQTQGEEAKYQKLLARVEQQKLELFDFSTASNLNDVVGSVSSYAKPDQKYWDTNNFYSQKDSRWGDKKIGGTKYLMKDFGCAVASVAMAYQFGGKNYTPQTILSRADFTNQALIYWPAGWVKRSFNSGVVDSQLENGKAVIVHIRKGSSAGHFVVIHHYNKDASDINLRYIVHDPYFGANLFLGTSRALVGKLGKDTGTSIDSMVIY